jgi:hypothetical protein
MPISLFVFAVHFGSKDGRFWYELLHAHSQHVPGERAISVALSPVLSQPRWFVSGDLTNETSFSTCRVEVGPY